jgi:hypothetical protein
LNLLFSSAGSERFLDTQFTSMSGTFSQIYGPQAVGGVFQVTSQFIGQTIVEGILKQFPCRKVQRGDLYADQARNLLQTHLELIDIAEQTHIENLLSLLV